MKTYLKLAMLAMVLIAPAGAYAADSVGGPIGNHQEARQEPQRILDPVEFFDKTTGKVKVWYWRAESGYEFYDAPGFHPRTGQALTGVTLDVITEWQQSQKNAKQCYIIQRDSRAPVIYRDRPPGIDPDTGRECRVVTLSVVERLKEYAEGKRPVRIKAPQPEFFDPRTSEPIVWYVDRGGTIEIFDLMGYHPETSEELLPAAPEIVDRWKAKQELFNRKPPLPVDPALQPWFDVKTGRPNIWHTRPEDGALEFFDSPGFHPRTGKALIEITQDFAEKLQKKADDLAREKQKQADDLAREKQKQADDLAREKQKQAEQKWREQQALEAQRLAASCDELAGNPNDQRRRSKGVGVSYDQLKTQIPEAIRACESAVRLLPADLTLQYQLARAVELVDPPRGQSMQDSLVKKGYPAAFDNAGSLLSMTGAASSTASTRLRSSLKKERIWATPCFRRHRG